MKKFIIILISLFAQIVFAQNSDSIKIESFQNSRIIIFSKEKSKSFVPDSIETFTPCKKDYYKLLNKIEKKSFKSWNKIYKLSYGNRQLKLKNDTLLAKIEGEWFPLNSYQKKIGKENVSVQILGAYYKNRKLLIYRIYDFNDGKHNQYIAKLENEVIEGNHGWFETNINYITIDLKTKKALNSLDFD